jgi:peptidoglycan-associated lipoprotein
MKLYKLVFSLFMLLTISNFAIAQGGKTRKADEAYNNFLYQDAIEKYKKALTKIDNKAKKAEVNFRIAESYRFINDTKNAEKYYAAAIKSKYPDPKAQLYLADMKKANEKYNEAVTEYQNYKKLVPSDPRGDEGAKSCEIAQKWKDNPTKHEIQNMPFNSKFSDFSPIYANKSGSALWFTSSRTGTSGSSQDGTTGESFSDIFEVKMDKKGMWSSPSSIGSPVNSKFNEGSASFNKKRSMVVFTRCPEQKKKYLGCELWYSEKKGNNWGEPVKINDLVPADSFTVGHPSISPDETFIVFASDMPGGLGGRDLWKMTFDPKSKKFGKPTNLGPMINTAGDEMFPFVAEDGSLFFASNGHLGMGGLDIFKADKNDYSWNNVTNLKFPINSAADDFGIVSDPEVKKGYFTSTRAGGKGNDDIYSFNVPPVNFSLTGTIFDTDDKNPIIGATVKLIGSDGSSVEIKTDAQGGYRFDFTPDGKRYVIQNVSYTVSGAMEKHLADKADFTTVGIDTPTDFTKDLYLKPIKKEPIRLPDILYDLAKWDLKPQFQDSLNGLIKTLNENVNLVIELGSHTDTRGDDKSNELLAQRRAQSVVDYLILKGIAGDRLVAKGYGESRPLITDAEIAKLPKDEQEAAHQKNRRTDFRILREDYVPKEDPNAPKIVPRIKNVTDDDEDDE